METKDRAKHVAPGEGKALWVAGDLVTLKVVGEDTSGSFILGEEVTPPGGGPPPHVHRREDETFFVLEGEYEFLVGGRTVRAGAVGAKCPGGAVVDPQVPRDRSDGLPRLPHDPHRALAELRIKRASRLSHEPLSLKSWPPRYEGNR